MKTFQIKDENGDVKAEVQLDDEFDQGEYIIVEKIEEPGAGGGPGEEG